MALFNITNLPGTQENCDSIPFKASNARIHIDTELYKISELEIFFCDADTLVDFKTSNSNINIDTIILKISQLQITEQQWLGNL